MNEQESDLKNFSTTGNDELSHLEGELILTKEYRRRKLILWTIRTIITIVLYLVIWEKYEWVKWTLFVTIPLSLISLSTIVIAPYLLNKKLEKTKLKLDNLNKNKV